MQLDDLMMYLIDAFIRLQLTAKNLPKKDRYDFLVKNYRKLLIEHFEFSFPKQHKIYLEKIKTTESGAWGNWAFDTKHPCNILQYDIQE